MNPNTLVLLITLSAAPWGIIGWIRLIKVVFTPFRGLGKKIIKKWAESELEDDV